MGDVYFVPRRRDEETITSIANNGSISVACKKINDDGYSK